MSGYGRIGVPEFYACSVQWGLNRDVDFTDMVRVVTPSPYEGGNIVSAFDMQPRQTIEFSDGAPALDGTANFVRIEIDTQASGNFPSDFFDFVAVMNHNMQAADGTIVIRRKSSPFTTSVSDGSDLSGVADWEVVSGSTTSGSDLLAKFQRNRNTSFRYYAIDFVPNGTWDAEPHVGNIMFGGCYATPFSADLGWSSSFSNEGVNILESYGGSRAAIAAWVTGADSGSYLPFRSTDDNVEKPTGRQTMDFGFSNISQTEVAPETLTEMDGEDNFFSSVITKTSNNLTPLLFRHDSSKVGDDMVMYCRMGVSTFTTTEALMERRRFQVSLSQEF